MQTAKTPEGRWRAWTTHEGRRIDRRGATKREAVRKLQEALVEQPPVAPRAAHARGLTVGAYVERVTRAQEGDVTFRTMHRKLTAWQRHAGDLAEVKLTAVKVPDVRAWRDALPRTRDAEFAEQALKQALDLAAQDELLVANPMKSLKRRPPKRRTAADGHGARKVKVYSDDELRALKAAGAATRIGRAVVLMADTGLRPAEARGLQWGDIEGETLHVRRQLYEYEDGIRLTDELKTDNSLRSIYIAPATVEALGPRGAPDDLVFPAARGALWRKAAFGREFDQLQAKAGVEKLGRGPHCLRHSHASVLLARNVPIADVAARLGDNVKTILIYYAHAVPGEDRTRDAVTALAGV